VRRPVRRSLVRAALEGAGVAEFRGPRAVADRAGGVRFLQAPGRLAAGVRVYAVGDVHGHLDRLVALHREISADLAARPVASAVLVHLGDYIDQGPDSAGVVSYLAGSPVAGVRVVNLMGDHERMLLDGLDGDRAAATDWLWAGGRDALASWGLDADLPREDWGAAFPAEHVAFLRSLRLESRQGGYWFVHAGVRPGVSEQSREDFLTIRQPFLSSEQDFGAVVVHGHSSVPSVPILANRIGLDTGAGMGGKLTAAVLEDDVIGLLAV